MLNLYAVIYVSFYLSLISMATRKILPCLERFIVGREGFLAILLRILFKTTLKWTSYLCLHWIPAGFSCVGRSFSLGNQQGEIMTSRGERRRVQAPYAWYDHHLAGFHFKGTRAWFRERRDREWGVGVRGGGQDELYVVRFN